MNYKHTWPIIWSFSSSANRAGTIPLVNMLLISSRNPATIMVISYSKHKAAANGPVGQVLAGPLFLKVKIKFHFTKRCNEQKCKGDF